MSCGVEIRVNRVISHPVFVPSGKEGFRHAHRIIFKVIKFNLKRSMFGCLLEFNNSFFFGYNLHTLCSYLTATADIHFGWSDTFAFAFPLDRLDTNRLSLSLSPTTKSFPESPRFWCKQKPSYYVCLLPILFGIFLSFVI